MTTETPETLHKKAREAVANALGDAWDCHRVWYAWDYGTMGQNDFALVTEDPDRVAEITRAALDAVGFDAILEERDRLGQALQWYGNQAKRMGDAVMAQDKQAMLTLMKDLAVDYGNRARVALKGAS